MPSKHTHDALLLATAPVAALFAADVLRMEPLEVVAIGVGVLAGIALTPDLDLAEAPMSPLERWAALALWLPVLAWAVAVAGMRIRIP